MSSFIVPLKSGGGLGTAQDDGEETGEGLDSAEVGDGTITAKPSSSQQNAISVFIWDSYCCFVGLGKGVFRLSYLILRIRYSFAGGKIAFEPMTIQLSAWPRQGAHR